MKSKEAEVDWTAVGELVRGIRRQQRLPYRELAQRAGISRGTLLRIEAGNPVRDSTLRKLEKALNISTGVLTHSAPWAIGPFFVQSLESEFIFVRPNPKYGRRVRDYTQEMLADPDERLRIGRLGIVSCFQWETDLGLPTPICAPS
jgi:transcriptional regulator with XRE-family HTH domain